MTTDAELKCGSCMLCENGCESAPTNKVNGCRDYERRLGDILKDCIHENEICKQCLMASNCSLPGPNGQPDMTTCVYFQPIKKDEVNHPSHYTQGGIECIKCIEASMKPEGFQDYCKGNVIKYIHRWREKGGVQDLHKAEVYLKWLIESAENGRIS